MDYSANTHLLEDSENESDQNIINDHFGDEAIDNEPLVKHTEPEDKYCMCYLIFYLLGITTLIPWNFFITADDYWMYKFRDVNNTTTLRITPGNRTPLQKELTSYLSIASAIPNTIILIFNTFINRKISLQIRMVGSLITLIVFFIFTTIFINVNTDSWQHLFFILTMSSVIILNVASAILSGSIFSIIGNFSPAYITAVVSGQALGGIFTTIIQIISLALGVSSLHSAFFYFTIGNIILILSLILYVVLSKSVFYRYHVSDKHIRFLNVQDESFQVPKANYRDVFRKVWLYGVCEWFVFVVTLSIFPGVTVLIESQNKGSGKLWSDLYFVPVVSYLFFNTGDYVGRILAGFFQWPNSKGYVILILNFLRIVFIPLLMLCNAQPRHHLPVLINEDIYYILIMIVFALSNGYLANIAVICAPKVVENHEKEMASSIVVAFLGLGLSIGSVLSLAMVKAI